MRRFDIAFVGRKVAVEIDGGNRMAVADKNGNAVAIGRHTKDADYEKINAAQELYWRVLRFSPAMVKSGAAIRTIGRVRRFPHILKRGIIMSKLGKDGQTWLQTTDAKLWADEFCKRNSAADHGTMIGWFANAIEAAQNAARREAEHVKEKEETIKKSVDARKSLPDGFYWLESSKASEDAGLVKLYTSLGGVRGVGFGVWDGGVFMPLSEVSIDSVFNRVIHLFCEGAGGKPSGCPHCGAVEIDSPMPRTLYECGSTDYDRVPGTFAQSDECRLRPPVPRH
jgi:hypothetical protein